MSNSPSISLSATDYAPVLTRHSLAGGDAEVVDANVDVVNTMYAELLDVEEIAPNALRSYYVDFYLTQSLAGGFAQYVFTAPEREDIDPYVRDGLSGMGAVGHLELFNRTVAAFESLTEEEADAYLDGDTELDADGPEGSTDRSQGTTQAVQRLEELDAEFESLVETEDITALNAAWLRAQQDLLILDEEELDRHIAERVSRIPNLEERQAEAAEDELMNAPGFELIIRELCDVAGHTLLKVTMGDPNYDHDGHRALAWHFTTDQGEFLMVEEDDEAFMIHPETREIVAAVEFAEEDA
ncbi:DMP19 family protein [Arthrobacter sp. UYCu723]